jgi:alkylation response protein AidB-like acyl-CoA dehydrogenase
VDATEQRTELSTMVRARTAQLLAEYPPATTSVEEFLGRQYDAGLAFVWQPEGSGGLGAPAQLQREVDETLRAAGAKSALLRNPLGVGMGLPTLRQHGRPDQIDKHERAVFSTAEIWCQLFSEPGSGSDLAGLATRAIRDGGDGSADWIVNGQKVWTSLGHLARVGMLLARTDPDAPKHRGITFFLLDMSAPGVEVRPLRQITGETEFNEVFLTDVAVPDSARVGAVGDGWRVATTTLMNERVVLSGAGSGASAVGGSKADRVIARAREAGVWDDPLARDELVRRWIEGQVIRLTNVRARNARRAGTPGPEGAVTKLYQGLYNRRLQDTAYRLLADSPAGETDEAQAALGHGLLRAQGNTIEGGTSDILRNVLAERVLGLPREPGPASDTPWSQLPRNS